MKLGKMAMMGLAGVMAFSMAGCGSKASDTSSNGAAATSNAVVATSGQAQADANAQAAGVLTANTDPANTEVTDKNITIGLASEPSAIWGAGNGTTENEEQIVSGAILDTLVAKDQKTGEIIPELATEWNWTDGTHLQFTLRDGVTMTDGSPLTADDVVYSVNVWKTASATSDTGRFLVGATKDADNKVTIEYNIAAPAMLEMMTMTNFGIVSEDEVNAAGGLEAACKNPVMGCGKYKFKSWNQGQNIVLERNDNYWNKDYKGYYKTITFTFTNDAAAREMAVESGDAQVAYDMPVSQAATFKDNDAVQTCVYTFGQVAHLWYNMTDSHPTKELALRQAIDKALDFDAIAQVGTAGFGKPALGYFEDDSPYYNQTYTAEERAVDVDGAKKILEDAGIATDGSVELTAIGLQDVNPIYTVMQENLSKIGITLKINITDTPTFVQDAFGGNYDLIMVGEYTAERYPTLLCFMQQATIDSGFVIGGPKTTTPEIDSAITQLIQETDTAKAKEEAGALEKTMKDQCIVSNLYPEMKASILAKNLKGYTTRERGFLDATNFYEAE